MSKAHTAMDEIKEGAFRRTESAFRNWVSAAPPPPGKEAEIAAHGRYLAEDGKSYVYAAESGRYHLYISLACPWACRCLLVRALKGLEDAITLSVTAAKFVKTSPDPEDQHHGWSFVPEEGETGVIPDTELNTKTVRELYQLCHDATGKFTVPILYDKKTKTIVNNESSEIIRMFTREFNAFSARPHIDLYPSDLRAQIDEINAWVYPHINNGVYKCGFARMQAPYNEAVTALFEHLDKVEAMLDKQRFLCGERFTEADVRLFTTLVRFDEVYHGHFKCNKKRIADYPNLENYTRDMYQLPGVAATVNMDHIKRHYHQSHPTINLFGIVPIGPGVDFSRPHDRNRFGEVGLF